MGDTTLGMKCGPSSQEQGLAASQNSFSSLLSSDFQQQFASQNSVLNNINAAMNPIVAAGPNQQGFSSAELADLNTKAINNSGAANRNAAQAASSQLAGRGGGGSSGLESGVDKQIRGSIASQQAGNLANTENNIDTQNYETGRQNFFNAAAGQRALAGLYNPSSYAGDANQAESSAFGQADKISDEENQKSAAIEGGITSLAMDAATFGAGGLAGGGGMGGGFGGFLKAGANSLGAGFAPPASGSSSSSSGGWGQPG